MDKLIELLNEIDDREVELEELKESGEAEEILECCSRLEDLKKAHLRESRSIYEQ